MRHHRKLPRRPAHSPSPSSIFEKCAETLRLPHSKARDGGRRHDRDARGTVGTDGSLTEMQAVYFGDNFDLNMYAEMVALTHQFPDIF